MDNSDDNQARKKRRLSDDGDESLVLPLAPEAMAVVRRGSVWFDDGSVILQVGWTQYRVHASLLSRCSNVFKDMFSLPQPSGSNSEPTAEGCPIVHLHDSLVDVDRLLTAIYDFPYSGDAASPTKPMKFSMVSALLRLGNKYDISSLRDHAVSRLRLEYPSTYQNQTSLGSGVYILPHAGRHFDTARLAYEEGVFSVLPLVLHQLIASNDTKVILEGKTRSNGDKITLPLPLIHACVIGKEKLAKIMCTDAYKFLKQRPIGQCLAQWHECCESRRQVAEMIWQPVPDLRYALHYNWDLIRSTLAKRNVKFCDPCSQRLSVLHDAGRIVVWEALPSIFGFGSWEEVKRMDRL